LLERKSVKERLRGVSFVKRLHGRVKRFKKLLFGCGITPALHQLRQRR
jgi:hypothetical protein